MLSQNLFLMQFKRKVGYTEILDQWKRCAGIRRDISKGKEKEEKYTRWVVFSSTFCMTPACLVMQSLTKESVFHI